MQPAALRLALGWAEERPAIGRTAYGLLHFLHHFHLLDEMGALRPFLLKESRF